MTYRKGNAIANHATKRTNQRMGEEHREDQRTDGHHHQIEVIRHDAFKASFNNAQRQPGSSIKPLTVYAPAVDMGLISPITVIPDYPYQVLGGSAWPVNVDGRYRGQVTVNAAVEDSFNTVAVRVLADLADDQNMIAAFQSGEDIHATTAAQVFGMPGGTVTPLMRSRAKAVNFGIVYGIGAFSLSQDIGVTVSEADSYIKSYLAHYAGVRKYMEDTIAFARENGYVKTLFGRRRYLPELAASNKVTQAFGERVARNTPIQGTAADIIKIAMIRVSDRLEKEGLQGKLILQVHDELIVECPPQEREQVVRILQEEMEGAVRLSVPMLAEAGWGRTWYDAKG